MELLLLLTVLVLFATTWLALFLSKLVTRPVAALAEATQEISRGRLDYRVEVSAADEIGDLVRSFNRMAEELETSRRQIEASSRELGAANVALEQRRRHIETILESIPTGVLSLDASRRITHVNHALIRMFHPSGARLGEPDRDRRLPCAKCFPRKFWKTWNLCCAAPTAWARPRRNWKWTCIAPSSMSPSLWRLFITEARARICSGLRRLVRPAEGAEADRMA